MTTSSSCFVPWPQRASYSPGKHLANVCQEDYIWRLLLTNERQHIIILAGVQEKDSSHYALLSTLRWYNFILSKANGLTCSSGTIVPLSGQDSPNDVSGEGSTIGFGLTKLEISQDGGSDTTLRMVTLSTTINWFQGNQSVLFSDRKGERSKIKVTEIPPMATRSKLWWKIIRQF